MKIEFGKGLFGRGLPPPENVIRHYEPPSVRLPSTLAERQLPRCHMEQNINLVRTAPRRSHFVDGSRGWW
jgi:hypothetical protein